MKYHNLAPVEMLKAYGKGELSVSDSKWVEQLIQNNPMVSAVAENISSINVATVHSISNKTSKSIAKAYLSKVGFWSKYGVWIGLSSIVLIIGLALFLQNSSNAIYEKKTIAQKLQSPNKVPSNNNIASVVPISDKTTEEDRDLSEKVEVDIEEQKGSLPEETVNETAIEEENKNFEVEMDQLQIKDQKSETDSKPKNELTETSSSKEDEETHSNHSDNTRSFSSKAETSASQSVVLSVQNVQILSKLNPKDLKRSNNSRNNRGQLNSGKKQAGSGGSYSLEDVPQFTGGDRGLQNYFIGQLRPLKIKKNEDRFDRTVMIELEINARGKMKDYKIQGNLHPKHQKALIKAIKDIPQFSKGSEKVVYSLAISF